MLEQCTWDKEALTGDVGWLRHGCGRSTTTGNSWCAQTDFITGFHKVLASRGTCIGESCIAFVNVSELSLWYALCFLNLFAYLLVLIGQIICSVLFGRKQSNQRVWRIIAAICVWSQLPKFLGAGMQQINYTEKALHNLHWVILLSG